MKKLLLSVGAFALIGSVSATGTLSPGKKSKAVRFDKNMSVTKEVLLAPSAIVAAKSNAPKSNKKVSSIGTQIGGTSYGLQSNSAIQRRIINYGDGTLSAVWTTANSGENGDFLSRGTGYNYLNGTSWAKSGATNYSRIEPVNIKTGFTNIVALPGNNEMTVAHVTGNGLAFTGSAKGGISWSTSIKPEATTSLAGGSNPHPLWARMAAGGPDGNTLHLFANYSDTTQKIGGVSSPAVYSRSLDGGATWDKVSVLLPNFATYFNNGGGDQYAIDAKGDTLVILNGGNGESLVMWKSVDNGSTFTETVIDSVNKDLEATCDTAFTSDGSGSIVLDANGNAHVAFSGCRVAGDGIADGSFSFFPGEIHLMYWNEVAKVVKEIAISDSSLTYGNGAYIIGTSTQNSPQDATPGARYGNNAMLCKPSIVVDAAGEVYISFSLPKHEDVDANNNSFRDIWLTKSCDRTAYDVRAFRSVKDLSFSPGLEESFATMAKNTSDGKLHIVFQTRDSPGVAYSGAAIAPDNYGIWYYSITTNNAFIENSTCLPVTNFVKIITTCDTSGIGVYEIGNANFNVAQNTPNPFNGVTIISVNTEKATKASFEVRNMLGQIIINKTVDMNAGVNNIEVNKSDLNGAGIYFYTVRVGKNIVTKKMLVE